MMHNGDRWWPGTITCTYHGATFNEDGELLEFIGEGPDSKIVGKMKCEVYPTRTLKGIVFLWMGEGEPAPIEEDIPPEFFSNEYQVLHSIVPWTCNWRAALENFFDAHASYVHRNSSQSFWNSSLIQTRAWPRPETINDRALVLRGGFGGGGRQRAMQATMGQKRPEQPWRVWYPRGEFYWPRTEYRRLWTWAFKWRNKRRAKRPMVIDDPEWQGTLMHLPGFVRTDGDVHQFSRWPVPVDQWQSRVWFFHATKPRSFLEGLYERIHFIIWNDLSKNMNFNGQDARQEVYQYYDKPEKLTVSDAYTIAWRKLMTEHARGLEFPGLLGVPIAEEFAEFEPIAPEAPAQMAQTGGGA
jgi:phenylpropionate dioxygenase-like ring-hydroxylating dioxygenase large terminal subunit